MPRVVAFVALTLPVALFSQPAPQQAAPPAALPRVTAEALDRSKVTLPSDFSSPLNLLIVSFARDQQADIDTWLPVAARLVAANLKVQTWVLPVSAWEDSIYKWWLNASMRGSLSPQQSAHYTVPVYVNKSQFLKSLAISSEKRIVVVLTDKAGVVLWRSDGVATGEKETALTGAAKKSLPAH